MPFDRETTLARIQEILRGTPLTNGGPDLVTAGVVNRVIARDGRVSLVLALGESAPRGSELTRVLTEEISKIDGVTDVQVLQKSAPGSDGSGAAPAGAAQAVAGQTIPGVAHTIAVASGKGGVGKSTVAVNLATELARRGHATGLLDADVYGPSIPKMLGLEGQQPRVEGEETILPIEAHGVRTMSIGYMLDDDSPVIWRGPMVTGLLRQFLHQVRWGELDYLVLDLPPGTGDAQLTLVQTLALSAGLIVTTPQDVALLDVRRGIQMFQRVQVPIFGVVENMSVFECPSCGHVEEIFSSGGGRAAAERYGVPFLGAIPLARSYADAGDRGRPVVVTEPESGLARVARDIAARLVEQLPV